jgi:hypothetical protein
MLQTTMIQKPFYPKQKQNFSQIKATAHNVSCMIQKCPTTNEALEQGIMLKWKPYQLLKMRFR